MTPSSTPPSPFAGERFWRAICDSIRQAVVVDDECHPPPAGRPAGRWPRPDRGRPRRRQDAAGAGVQPRARAGLLARPGHAGPAPERHPRRERARGLARFRFIPGPIFTNVLLVDEINRATPRSQSALLEAMEERPRLDRGRDARPAGPVPRAGDREPHRAGGHVRLAGGAAGPLPRPDPARLPESRR